MSAMLSNYHTIEIVCTFIATWISIRFFFVVVVFIVFRSDEKTFRHFGQSELIAYHSITCIELIHIIESARSLQISVLSHAIAEGI